MRDWGPSDSGFYMTQAGGEEILDLSKHTASRIICENVFNLTS